MVSFISNRGRYQYVYVNNTASEKLPLQYGVPQGSILGPLLFVVYINDLPFICSFAKFILYADDANIIISENNIAELQNKIELLLEKLQSWVNVNGLKLNIQKTKYMIFSNVEKTDLNIKIKSTPISRSRCEKFLGILVDDSLSWTDHINGLASKISRNVGILYKLKGIVPESVLRTLYNSFVQSNLNYCSTVWGLKSKHSVEKVFRVQKKAIRAIENRFNNFFYNKETKETACHTKDIFARNKLLSVHNLIAKNTLSTMHKICMNLAPRPILNMFHKYGKLPENSRRAPMIFEVPFNRLRSADKSLPYIGPKFYNDFANLVNTKYLKDKADGVAKQQPLFQNKFYNPFKNCAKTFLLATQNLGDPNTWDPLNFPLYTSI